MCGPGVTGCGEAPRGGWLRTGEANAALLDDDDLQTQKWRVNINSKVNINDCKVKKIAEQDPGAARVFLKPALLRRPRGAVQRMGWRGLFEDLSLK